MKKLEWRCLACHEVKTKHDEACWLEQEISKAAGLHGTRVCRECYNILTG